MQKDIRSYCDQLLKEFHSIPPGRKVLLEKLAAYVKDRLSSNLPAKLVYVCTHNSRRSHFGQVWSQVAADYFNVPNFESYSGGTVVTAFNPNAIRALERVGFEVKRPDGGINPHYLLKYDPNKNPVSCFSKLYDDRENPREGFAAVMTCSEAEENCPFVPGAGLRVSTTYEDPKLFDGSPLQDQKYDERCRQIAREIFYMFSVIADNSKNRK